jgi:hypothetical protein
MLIRGAVRIAIALLILGVSSHMAHTVPAQERVPADIAAEPHHRLLLKNGLVRVFGVAIPPRQESYVQHEYNFLTVTLRDGEAVMWQAGESDVMHVPAKQGEAHFFLGGSARGTRNEFTTEYSNITVEFLDPRVTNYGYRWETGTWDYGSRAVGVPMDPHAHFVNQLDLAMAVVSDVQLLSKESLGAATQVRGELVIAVTPLELSRGNDAKINLAPGEVLWLDRRVYRLTNAAAVPARFVIVAFRPADY